MQSNSKSLKWGNGAFLYSQADAARQKSRQMDWTIFVLMAFHGEVLGSCQGQERSPCSIPRRSRACPNERNASLAPTTISTAKSRETQLIEVKPGGSNIQYKIHEVEITIWYLLLGGCIFCFALIFVKMYTGVLVQVHFYVHGTFTHHRSLGFA